VRSTALVAFCLALIGTLGVVFTRVIAARVPEQRATLEKLITDRTGLAVRFDNVHFAWNLDGTSAVFTRVELTDPARGRVRVVAPELRVEFDTWDFLRHHEFSLGHVTLSSPDIEIIGDPEERNDAKIAPRPANSRRAPVAARSDEAALVRRYLAWAELMPNGRIEVEGARVHLMRRGNRAAHQSFTLSQAVVSRGTTSFTAYGTMLLAQDVGQSLFVSVKLENLGPEAKPSGDLRLIARRVFLDKLPLTGIDGRGTLDAKLQLRDGRIASGSWTASARELELNGEQGERFDHVTINGALRREGSDVLVDLTDLQLTRGARLERAPGFAARFSLEQGSVRIARTSVVAERVPFMAAEFIAAVLARELTLSLPEVAGEWTATAGVLRGLRFDSGDRLKSPDAWTFTAQVEGGDLSREADHARLSELRARVRFDARQLQLIFDPTNAASMRLGLREGPRALKLGGQLVLSSDVAAPGLVFEEFDLRSGEGSLSAHGGWNPDAPRAEGVTLALANVDRALAQDLWSLMAHDRDPPALLADIGQGRVVEGSLQLRPARDASGIASINWQRSSGALTLAELATVGHDMPLITAGNGTLSFSRGNTQLHLLAGQVEDLAITGARLDWPRGAAPRLHASLEGQLNSRLLRDTLAAQGLERLAGAVAVEADARGERELKTPALWRINARISAASVPLGGGLPPLEKLAGTIRYSSGQLRGLALAGSWLGGPVEIESRRASVTPSARGALAFNANGVADAAPLLRLLGQVEAAGRVNGQLSWNGSAQRLADDAAWQISLTSNLAGLESRLPEPFDKVRARQIPVSAELRVDNDGIRDFAIESGRDLVVRGELREGVIAAHFLVQGVEGDVRRGANADANPEIEILKLDVRRSPAVLAAAGALLPVDGDLAMTVGDLHYADRSLGALHAAISRRDAGVEFSFESPQAAPHQLSAQGTCGAAENRCRAEFTADTTHLAALLGGAQLPAEWPMTSLHAAGELSWPVETAGDIARSLAGHFDLETQGADSGHQLLANATLADGQIQLANVQGSGPAPDQVFRGTGRVNLLARNYDLAVDYEQLSIAATAMPTPARARFARAWNVLRGSVARRGWTEAPESKRVQWHGTWESERPE
jgi:hypothetical protein